MTQGDFQSQVNVSQVPGILGDFASKNPRSTVIAGPGGLVAGPSGVAIAHFAWATAPVDGDGSPAIVTNNGVGAPTGFVHREQQGLIVNFLASSGMTIQPGFPVTLHNDGDFWVLNSGTGQALPGMKAYANFADGSVQFAASGSTVAGGTSTASTIAAGTSSVTASIANALMTVTAVGSGTLYNGTVLSGTGVVTGTQIVSQVLPLLTGEALGGIGRYNVSYAEQTVASTTISGTYGLLTIGGTVGGTFGVGQLITSGGVTAGTSITALGTGTGGAGTYIVNLTQTVTSQAINTAADIETKWYCRSSGLPGEYVKISSRSLATSTS